MSDPSLAGKEFVDADISGLVIDGINVAHAFEYLRKHRTAPGGYYYLTHKRDGTFVGDDENVKRRTSGEVDE